MYFLSGPVNFGDFFNGPIASQSNLINYFDLKLNHNSLLDLSTNTSPAPLSQFEVHKITLYDESTFLELWSEVSLLYIVKVVMF